MSRKTERRNNGKLLYVMDNLSFNINLAAHLFIIIYN